MGMYDTYGTVQLKAGEPDLRVYKVGDVVSIDDGVYISNNGIVVIDGTFLIYANDYLPVFDVFGTELSSNY